MSEPGFLETLNSLFGGAVTTLIGAFTGRLMYHSGEVKLGRRRFFWQRAFVGNPCGHRHGDYWRGHRKPL